MQQDLSVDGESVPSAAVSARSALLSCAPGTLALLSYAFYQWRDIPLWAGYLFWPFLAAGVVLGFVCVGRFRRAYRGRRRPWYVSLSIAAHVVVLLVGVPFLVLLLLALLVGDVR